MSTLCDDGPGEGADVSAAVFAWMEEQRALLPSLRDPAFRVINSGGVHHHALIEDHDDHDDEYCGPCVGHWGNDAHRCNWSATSVVNPISNAVWVIDPETGDVTIKGPS